MQKLSDGILLYHASYTENGETDPLRDNPHKDYGQGFYVVPSYEQAKICASRSIQEGKARGILSQDYSQSDGVVNVYRLDSPLPFAVQYFEKPDKNWLHYVASNRNHSLFEGLLKDCSSFDIVGGRMIDDNVARILNLYTVGAYGDPGTELADDFALKRVQDLGWTDDQFCFRTEKAIQSLFFLRSEKCGNVIGKETVPEQQKNLCSIEIMNVMVRLFSSKYGLSYEDTLLSFAESKTYEVLFNFDSGLWREGSSYLLDWYEHELAGDYYKVG